MRLPWNRMESELKREVAHHLAQLAAEYQRQGYSREEAAWMAKREFGGSEQVKELCRDEQRVAGLSLTWLSGIGRDLALAMRQMRRSPGFAITAVITLALGIAANVIVFGVVQAMILQPLDLPHAEHVMTLGTSGNTYPVLTYAEIHDVAESATTLSAVGGFTYESFGVEVNGAAARPIWGLAVSGPYFDVMGIKPCLGRLLRREDDRRGGSEVAVLSWSSWKGEFGGDRNIVGKTVRIDKHKYTIVGVAQEGFHGTERFFNAQIFVPIANHAWWEGPGWLEQRKDPNVFSVVRFKEGVTPAQVKGELDAIAARVRRQHPVEEEKLGYRLATPGLMGDFLGGPARAFLAGVMGLAGIVLLAACVNLGGLFAARTLDRTREIAIRMAIGSSRWRVVRQVLVEALAISLLGGACACVLGWMALSSLADWHPPTEYALKFFVMPQPSLVLIAFAASVFAGLFFGIAPLRQIFKTDPNDAIKSGGAQTFAGRRWALRDALLAAQIALCCVTVTAAFVSLRGLGTAMRMDLGFQPRNAIVTRFFLSQAGYLGDAAERVQKQLLERVLELPDVAAAAYGNSTPLKGDALSENVFSQETSDLRPSTRAFSSYYFDVSPGYLAAAGTPLLAGRDFTLADRAKAPLVAVVNQTFAQRLYHSSHAVGRYFKNASGALVQIIGLVKDGKYVSLSEDPQESVFFPILQRPTSDTVLVVRTKRPAPEVARSVRDAIRAFDPAIAVRESSEWSTQLAVNLFPAQAATVSLGLFGAFGLLLSIAGTFGLASYTVTKRLRELSIRVALGANGKQVLSAALGRMLVLLASGCGVGVVLGLATSRVLAAIVYHASAQDPVVLVSVAATMSVAGCLSIAGPVRRALRFDPATLLREQ